MEDFCYAGGLPVVMRELLAAGLLHGGAMTVTGRSIAENVADAECFNRDVIRTVADPLQPLGSGTAVLRGNLCPDGAVIKQSAVTGQLMRHRGRAVVFESPEDYHAVCDDPDLDVGADDVLVIRGAGPRGYPGMPEVANVPVPTRLLKQGITDIVRICDGRMSGTGFGTVVLHVAPEAAVGGPLALVRTGDPIMLDVPARTLDVEVSAEEMESRAREWIEPESEYCSGYTWLYRQHILQADSGADFDFLRGQRGYQVPRDSR
jgi:dihydroxyacid dehydratase/phosphogluconate dehydratase